jgi:hypothetical protein
VNTTPTMVLNYNNAVVYIIDCLDVTICDIYIGSTIDFEKTLHSLKAGCKKTNSKTKLHNFIKNNGGIDNFRVIILEKLINCKSKKEMLNYQVEYMDFFFPNLNTRLPIIPDRERYFNDTGKWQMKEHRMLNIYLSHKLRIKHNAIRTYH